MGEVRLLRLPVVGPHVHRDGEGDLEVQEVLRYQVEGEADNRSAALALLLALPLQQGC